ncbi:MAG TPA: hypothetical protein VJA16_06195 [Thermoanaerobaculia bacterium]
MRSRITVSKPSYTILAGALLLGLAPALAADTQEWGHDVVRVTSSAPSELSVGPSGATMQSSTSSGSGTSALRRHRRRLVASDVPVSASYCVELAPADGSAPYRLIFQFTSDGSAAASRSFDLATNVDTYATTGGDASLTGALYDQGGTLVAEDAGSGSRLAASLPAGQYSLVLDGVPADGTYVVTADQGSCSP